MNGERSYYVLRTENMGSFHWFAGTVNQYGNVSMILTDLIFLAYEFGTEAEAQEANSEFEGVFAVVPCIGGTV